ncbi:MAG: hypothetical protein ACREA0_04725 [bacterium]
MSGEPLNDVVRGGPGIGDTAYICSTEGTNDIAGIENGPYYHYTYCTAGD